MRLVLPLILASLIGCASSEQPTPTFKGAEPDYLESPVATCGAGLSRETKAMLVAEWTLTGGKVTAGLEQLARSAIFSDPAVSSGDKQLMFDRYTSCIVALSSSCAGRCSAASLSCQRQRNRSYASCIGRAQFKCIDTCADRFRISLDECRLDRCDPNDRINIENWNRMSCRSAQDALEDCDYNYQECLSMC